MEDPPLHGYALTTGERRLLRGPPPARALAWCAAAVGRGAVVTRVAALPGGTSSAVHAVDVRDADGSPHRLVLRRYVRADWLAEEPGAPRREVAALAALSGSGVPAPALVAADPEGTAAGAPAVLMTRLPGVLRWRPDDLEPFLRALAAALAPIHAVAVPAGSRLPRYRPYPMQTVEPPPGIPPEDWRRALAVFDGLPPVAEGRFIHRDFHPGNVLWEGDVVTGIVDWAAASLGSPAVDVGHCRMNLARVLGPAAAERFSALHRALSGRDDDHPYWDVAALLGGLRAQDLATWTERDGAFLRQALRRL